MGISWGNSEQMGYCTPARTRPTCTKGRRLRSIIRTKPAAPQSSTQKRSNGWDSITDRIASSSVLSGSGAPKVGSFRSRTKKYALSALRSSLQRLYSSRRSASRGGVQSVVRYCSVSLAYSSRWRNRWYSVVLSTISAFLGSRFAYFRAGSSRDETKLRPSGLLSNAAVSTM